MSKRTHDGQKKTDASPFKIPDKEMILTRGRTVKMQRQLRTKTPEKSPPIVQTRTQKSPVKTVPTKEKSKSKVVMKKMKIVLKPPQKMTKIVVDKRKSSNPKKASSASMESNVKITSEKKLDAKEIKTVKHEGQRSLKQRILEEKADAESFSELIRTRELEDLTDEDLLEIVQCPSPVWWEDPPDERYDEDPIFVGPELSRKKETNPPTQKNSLDEQVIIPPITESKCEEKFLKKRNILENVLNNLKRKEHKEHSDPSNSKIFPQSEVKDMVDNVMNSGKIIKSFIDNSTKTEENMQDSNISNTNPDNSQNHFVSDNNEVAEKLNETSSVSSYKSSDDSQDGNDSNKNTIFETNKQNARDDLSSNKALIVSGEDNTRVIPDNKVNALKKSQLKLINSEKLKSLKLEIAQTKIEDAKLKVVDVDVKDLVKKIHSHLPNVKCVTANTMKSIQSTTNEETKKVFSGSDSAELIPNKQVIINLVDQGTDVHEEVITINDSPTDSKEKKSRINDQISGTKLSDLKSESQEYVIINEDQKETLPFLDKLDSKRTSMDDLPDLEKIDEETESNILIMGMQNYEDISNFNFKCSDEIEVLSSTTNSSINSESQSLDVPSQNSEESGLQSKDEQELSLSERKEDQSEKNVSQIEEGNVDLLVNEEVIDFNSQYSHEVEILSSDITSDIEMIETETNNNIQNIDTVDISNNISGDNMENKMDMKPHYDEMYSSGVDSNDDIYNKECIEMCRTKSRADNEHNYHHLPESPVKHSTVEETIEKQKCEDNQQNLNGKCFKIINNQSNTITNNQVNSTNLENTKITETDLKNVSPEEGSSLKDSKNEAKISKIRNVYRELIAKIKTKNDSTLKLKGDAHSSHSNVESQYSKNLDDELSKTAITLSKYIKTPEKNENSAEDAYAKGYTEWRNENEDVDTKITMTKEMIDNIIGVGSNEHSAAIEQIVLHGIEDSDSKGDIVIAQKENLKYCFKCSSIYDTDQCSYCLSHTEQIVHKSNIKTAL